MQQCHATHQINAFHLSSRSDDFFRLGVRITRGSVRLLFRDMLEADVVIASPVAVAASLEEALKAPGEGKADWLSSVEVLAVVRADFLSMQNWRHVTTAVGALNRLPETQHCDIMRVREWALAGQGAHFRQTVVLTSFESAEVAAMVAQSCRNHAGCLRIEPSHPGVLSRLPAGAQIMFDGVESGEALGRGVTMLVNIAVRLRMSRLLTEWSSLGPRGKTAVRRQERSCPRFSSWRIDIKDGMEQELSNLTPRRFPRGRARRSFRVLPAQGVAENEGHGDKGAAHLCPVLLRLPPASQVLQGAGH